MQINVGTDGRATATSTTTSTFPESIQASIQKDGKTLMAMK